MTQQRVERLVTEWLEDAARPRIPDYFPEVLAATARTRQRPAWTFPERWLPMIVARQRLAVPAPPWRFVAVALLLIVLIVAGLLAAGSRSRVPPPFGPAANGHVAYEAGGDIYTADPVTGVSRAIVTGPEMDVAPRWSRDGARLVFERKEPGANLSGPGRLYIANADGSNVIRITPDPLTQIDGRFYAFSPDGTEIMVSWVNAGRESVSFARTDGSGIRHLDLGMPVAEPVYRPPLGHEIAFVRLPAAGTPVYNGLYTVNVDGANLRALIAPSTSTEVDAPAYAPDGSRLAYSTWPTDGSRGPVRVHVMRADGSGDREIDSGRGDVEAVPVWSNDGTRLLLERTYASSPSALFGAIVNLDNPSIGVESRQPLIVGGECCTTQDWSPDDTKILVAPIDQSFLPLRQVTWDTATGEVNEATWPGKSDPAWQRRAP